MDENDHDLLLMVLGLSELKDEEVIRSRFISAVQRACPGARLRWHDPGQASHEELIEVATSRSHFGWLAMVSAPAQANQRLLIAQSIRLLALTMENRSLRLGPAGATLPPSHPAIGSAPESDGFYETVFFANPLGILLVNPSNHRILRSNGQLCQVLGYSEAELQQLTDFELMHPDDLEQDVHDFAEHSEMQGAAFARERRYFHKNGTICWVRVTARLIAGGSGGEPMLVRTVEEISGRKHNERLHELQIAVLEQVSTGAHPAQSLELVARHYEESHPAAAVAVLLSGDRPGRFTAAAAPSLPTDYAAAVAATDFARSDCPCAGAGLKPSEGREPDRKSTGKCAVLLASGGTEVWRSCYAEPIRDSSGEFLGLLAIYHRQPRGPACDDRGLVMRLVSLAGLVIERHRALRTLRDNERRFRELAEHLPQIVFEADTEGRLTLLNQTGRQVLGFGDGKLPSGLGVVDLFAAQEHKKVARYLKQCAGSGPELSSGLLTRATTQRGVRIPVLLSGVRMMRGDHCSGVRGLLVDVSGAGLLPATA